MVVLRQILEALFPARTVKEKRARMELVSLVHQAAVEAEGGLWPPGKTLTCSDGSDNGWQSLMTHGGKENMVEFLCHLFRVGVLTPSDMPAWAGDVKQGRVPSNDGKIKMGVWALGPDGSRRLLRNPRPIAVPVVDLAERLRTGTGVGAVHTPPQHLDPTWDDWDPNGSASAMQPLQQPASAAGSVAGVVLPVAVGPSHLHHDGPLAPHPLVSNSMPFA